MADVKSIAVPPACRDQYQLQAQKLQAVMDAGEAYWKGVRHGMNIPDDWIFDSGTMTFVPPEPPVPQPVK